MSDPAPFLRYLKTAFVALLLLALSACLQDPLIESFTASPEMVTPGTTVTLRWQASNYDSLTLNPAVGDVSGRSGVTVTPESTTTYVLEAKKGSSEQTRSVTVQVGEPPDISFTAAEIAIGEGESTTLSWEVTGEGDTSVTLTSDDGLRVDSLPKEGSYDTGPLSADTSYTLTAENDFGSSAAALHVQVGDGPTVNAFAADPAILPEGGGDVTLSWDVAGEGSLSVEISSDNGPDLGPVEPVGSETVTVTETTTFVLNATDDEGERTAEVTVEVEVSSGQAPVIGLFEASPETIDEGDSTTLSWNVTAEGGVTVTLTSDKGLELASLPAEGSYTTEPLTEDTTYTLTAENEFGSVSSDPVTVTVISAPPPPPPGHITLLIAGQSNASGEGEMTNPLEAFPEVQMLGNNYVWEKAREPLDSTVGQFEWDVSKESNEPGHSFGVSLGNNLFEATQAEVFLIPSARGATCVKPDPDGPGCKNGTWYPIDDPTGRSTLFGNAIFRAKVSAGEEENPNESESSGVREAVTGLVWYQGESDAGRSDSGFINNTNDVMDAFVAELGVSIIYVQLGPRYEENNGDTGRNLAYQRVREWQRQMETGANLANSNRRQNYFMVVTHDLPMYEPNHLSAEGQKILGERIALAYQEHVLGDVSVDGTGPRLASITLLSTDTIKVKTTQSINDHDTYDGYFTVFVEGAEKTVDNGGIIELWRDPSDTTAVLITLNTSVTSNTTVRYMPPKEPPTGSSYNSDCDCYPSPTAQRVNVVQNAAGLPLPAFGPLPVD